MSGRDAEDVSEQGGLKWMVLCLFLAILIGILVRLMVAPRKVELAIRAQIEKSEFQGQIDFRGASVAFANGLWPDFALVLTDVSWRPMASCESKVLQRTEAPARAASLRLPLRWSSILRAEFSLGRIVATELVIDLDEIKRRCPTYNAQDSSDSEVWSKISGNLLKSSNPEPVSVAPGSEQKFSSTELFSEKELIEIQRVLKGISIQQAELFFEGRMKSVVVEEFRATIKERGFDFASLVRIPPATAFGESVPVFSITGTIQATEIFVQARAELNEGTLDAYASLKPVVESNGTRELETNLKLNLSDLPLSMMTPLLVKSNLVPAEFRPQFAWLDCNAEIQGIFSQLVLRHPLTVSNCSVSGRVGRMSLAKAVRQPDGSWLPFSVRAEAVEVGRILDAFQIRPAAGVVADFGRYAGVLQFEKTNEFSFAGKADGVVIRFAGGEGTALQAVDIESLKLSGRGGIIHASADGFKPIGGDADLRLELDHELQLGKSKFHIDLKKLKMNSRVEKVLFNGSVAEISGTADGALKADSLTKLKAKFEMKGMHGNEIQVPELRIEATVNEAQHAGPLDDPAATKGSQKSTKLGTVEILAKAPVVDLPKSGYFFKVIKPALLGWDGPANTESKKLELTQAMVRGAFVDSGFKWTSAQASVGSNVTLFSQGQIFRDQVIEAKVEAKFPATSRLGWSINGTWKRPQFVITSEELRRLLQRPDVKFTESEDGRNLAESGVVPIRYLGLPVNPSRPK